MRILRNRDARDKTGDRRSEQYQEIRRWLYSPQVQISDKAVGWIEEELEALNELELMRAI